jgi:molecular chaperone GrpE (heat shock protein)
MKTIRCTCGRLHQTADPIDPSSELARVTAQRDNLKKQNLRKQKEITNLRTQVKKLKEGA